jgi:hypothetical protein
VQTRKQLILFKHDQRGKPKDINAGRRKLAITDRAIDQAFSDLKTICGGVRNDYFGLLYLVQEFSLDRERAISQVAFGGNDYGVDGFHFDEQKRNLYIYFNSSGRSRTLSSSNPSTDSRTLGWSGNQD